MSIYFVIRFKHDFLLLEIDKQLIGVVIQAGIPDFHELRRDLDQDFRILMGILVVAAPQVFFVERFKRAARLIDDKTLVFRHALDLYAAPAERDVRVFKKLLGFAEILRAFFQWDKLGPLTNGSNLLQSYPTFSHATPYVILAGLMIAVIVLLINSTYGRAFKAIRDDEVAAEAMGINLARHKRLAFCISSFFAGVGGGLFAMFANQAQAKVFTTAMTYEILLIVVIGGIGSISGSCIAAFLYVAASEWWLRFLDAETYIGSFKVPFLRTGFRMVVFSVIIMVVVLFFRKGIMGDKELPDLLKKRQKKAKKEAVQP